MSLWKVLYRYPEYIYEYIPNISTNICIYEDTRIYLRIYPNISTNVTRIYLRIYPNISTNVPEYIYEYPNISTNVTRMYLRIDASFGDESGRCLSLRSTRSRRREPWWEGRWSSSSQRMRQLIVANSASNL